MSRAWLAACIALLALAGCASPTTQGPVANTGKITGDPTTPRNRARVHTELATLYYSRGNHNVALEELRTAAHAKPWPAWSRTRARRPGSAARRPSCWPPWADRSTPQPR
jgi:Tfp pilus assembly protein PilF